MDKPRLFGRLSGRIRGSRATQTLANGGFTLLEMLVVIAIMGLILAALAGYGPPKSRWLETRAAARSVADAMLAARGAAMTTGQDVALRLPPAPDWLAETLEAPGPAILFHPDGSSTGGTVVLDDAGRRMAVTADWLTGRVSVVTP
jgi:general secretion pathway protein H